MWENFGTDMDVWEVKMNWFEVKVNHYKAALLIPGFAALCLFLLMQFCLIPSARAGSGSLWGMGDNYHGQLGQGTAPKRPTPVRIENSGVIAIDTSSHHSLYVKSDGSLRGMGKNSYGQLGDGTTTSRHTPVLIESDGVVDAAAGYNHSLYIKSDGSLWGHGR